MDEILHGYRVNNETWFYLSLILIIAVFFRFNRLWSIRNLDLVLLLSLSPGLIWVNNPDYQSLGYAWMFAGTGVILLRLFLDARLRRRPRLEPNMNLAGLAFLCIAAFMFLMTKVIVEKPDNATVQTVRKADQLLHRKDSSAEAQTDDEESVEARPGPAGPLLATPIVPTSKLVEQHNPQAGGFEQIAARIVAVLAHFTVVLGLILLGRRHLGDTHLGLAMATLYMLLPCTAFAVGKVNHVLPAALIVWAFVSYRMPMVAGALMGLACGSLFFPIFLLPLWMAFYGRRGAVRFGVALSLVCAVLMASLMLTSVNAHSFTRQLIGFIDWKVLEFQGNDVAGFWSMHDSHYRLPIGAAYLVMVVVLAVWPRRKNLEHLMAHSTAIIVATQLWYPRQGGVYLLWYLPLLLMVVFRPRIPHLGPPDDEPSKTLARDGSRPSPRSVTLSTIGSGRLFW